MTAEKFLSKEKLSVFLRSAARGMMKDMFGVNSAAPSGLACVKMIVLGLLRRRRMNAPGCGWMPLCGLHGACEDNLKA
jgi:hypothetical protein